MWGSSLQNSHSLSLFQKHGVNAVLQERQAYPYGSRHGLTRKNRGHGKCEAIVESKQSKTGLSSVRSLCGIQLLCFSSPWTPTGEKGRAQLC